MKTARIKKTNSKKLQCIQCERLMPLEDFYPAAIMRKHTRVCLDCRREQTETDQYTKELDNDLESYTNYLCKHASM